MKLLIFILSINFLFSGNIAVLLGDFKTKDGSYMNKIATMLKNRNFEVIDDIQVDTKQPIDVQASSTFEKLVKNHIVQD